MPEPSLRVRFARSIAAGEHSLRLYAILDFESCVKRNLDMFAVASAWHTAGVRLLQYRDKVSSRDAVEERAHTLRAMFPENGQAFLILNDDPELAARCRFDGVHVGQADASVAHAREAVGPDRVVGISTHSVDQALQAQGTECDYVAIGPVFTSATKPDAEPVVGLCGLQAARAVVSKPLVAIGGIRLGDAHAVLDAGADSVATISALLSDGLVGTAQGFLRQLT